MPRRAICDANVFRYLGAADIALADLRALCPGASIWLSPATVLELVSRYTEGSFEHRQAAARAMISVGTEILPDPEVYLTRDVFGLRLNEVEFDWNQAILAMAQAQDMQHLQGGVADYKAHVKRAVSLQFARSYREGVDRDFIEDMLTVQRREIPGLAEWLDTDPQTRRGCVPTLDRERARQFEEHSGSDAFMETLFAGALLRALFKTDELPPYPATEAWVERRGRARNQLEFYLRVYRRYLIRLLTAGMLPRANDWFDLEVMLYSSDDDCVIVSSDAKWASMATEEGLGHRTVVLTPRGA
jgi:hypothetical protein